MRIGLGYATRTYRLPPDALDGDLAMLDAATPQHPRTGALQALEGGRWMLTLAGILGDHPPTDPDGFLAFARSLRFPDIYEAVRDGEPLDDPVGFRFPASVRHRYERLDRFPDGLLVLGDAVASFNPIYGQGMSVAALEALTLRRHLRRGIEPRPRRWFRDLARVVDVPWDMSAGGDLAFPGVQGRRTPKVRLVSAYLARLHAAAAHDAHLATAFIRVAGLVAPPQSLLRPGVVLRVLRNGLGPARDPPRGCAGPDGPYDPVLGAAGRAGPGHLRRRRWRVRLVVGADGLRSSVRRLAVDPRPPVPVGQHSWRFLAACPPEVTTWTVMPGPGTAFLTVPVGLWAGLLLRRQHHPGRRSAVPTTRNRRASHI